MHKPPRLARVDLPVDYAERVTLTRHALRLTLSEFAIRLGAANKAVVYQWESGKRRPSPVFWARITALPGARSITKASSECHVSAGLQNRKHSDH